MAMEAAMEQRKLQVAPDRRSLQWSDGKPFFWLGDTCWSCPGRARWEEWELYTQRRAQQGFTVLQLNSLPQYDSVHPGWETRFPFPLKPNGLWDFARPQTEYFAFLRRMIERADANGLVSAVVVLWFNYVPHARIWTVPDPRSDMSLAEGCNYAAYLADLLKGLQVVWVLTGDDTYLGEGVPEYTRALGAHLRKSDRDSRLITVHPARIAGPWFHSERWLDVTMVQSSHFDATQSGAYELVQEEWKRDPPRPIVNGEICYEEHPGFDFGHRFDRSDVRKAFWWTVLSGALGGVTYGADGLWPWIREGDTLRGREPESFSTWRQSLDLPGAADLARAKEMLVEIGWQRLRPAPQRLLETPARHVPVAASPDGSLLLAYFPRMPQTWGYIELETSGLAAEARASWWHPETGGTEPLGPIRSGRMTFRAPEGKDSLLVIRA
jgi:hypothetical protein